MNWKNWFEGNAFFVVVGACVATGGVVAGVMQYYSGQRIEIIKEQHASEMSGLKTQLASISRSIGHEEYLDVTKIVVSRDRISPAANSQYFDDAEFYAPQASGAWRYSKTSEAALAESLTEADVTKVPFIQKAGNLAPIHMWRTKKTLSVRGGPGFKNLFPYVYVERVSVESFKGAVGALVSKDESPPTTTQSKETARPTGSNPSLDSMFRGDIAGKLLTFILAAQLSLEDVMPAELLNVQKVHNVVYVAVRYTLKDVEVEKIKYPHYYIYSEVVIISDGPNATIVKTFVPSPDPSGNADYSQYVSSWLNDLRVLVG